MQMSLKYLPCFLMVACVASLLVGCDTSGSNSIYEENPEYTVDPSITGVAPEDGALSGVGVVTIQGSNFSTEASDNLVFFGGARAEVLSASPTVLEVRPPNTPGEDLQLKVAVLGAENFGVWEYTLLPTVEPVGDFTPLEEPVSIAGDAAGNFYVSLLEDGTPGGIQQVTPEGERIQYAPAQSWTYRDMRFGPDGGLYAVRGAFGLVYRVPPGGGDAAAWARTPSFISTNLAALDFDQNGNIWAGGNNEDLYRIAPDKSAASFPFSGNITALRVFESAIYVVTLEDSMTTISRAPIDGAGNPGSFETYFDFSAEVGTGGTVQSIAFANDGTLYAATNGPHGIVTVSPNGAWEPYYPGLFHPAILSLAWGMDPFLYAVLQPTDEALAATPDLMNTVLKINTQKQSPN